LTNVEIGLASIGFILFFIYTGMHVPLAFCLVSLLGVWAIRGNFEQAAKLLALAASDAVAGYDFGVIPLFVLMGMLVSIAELGRDAFVAANAILGRVKGGLGIATVGANAVFAAVTGVSIASAAVFTKIAVPEMIRLGYRPRFAVGVVAGSSVLGMLIPPSLLLIVFGLLSEQSIGDLFIAGVVPGLLLAAAFALMIIVVATLAPSYVQATAAPAAAKSEMGLLHALVRLIPLLALAALVIGGIYAGWFTPTESGAVGALGALVLALARRKLNAGNFWRVLVETGQITVSIMLLIIAANIYSRLLALSGMPATLEQWINSADLGFYALLIIYSVIIVLLGTLIDGVSIMLIMVPMFLPLVKTFGVNLVWFGIVTVLAVEIGLLTPPMGLSVYAIKSSLADPRISLNDIFVGAAPYAAVMFAVLLLIIFIPSIALVLL
jgi:tripartite ATP-independent transporter DctM subunit